jgi:hypothetical protein
MLHEKGAIVPSFPQEGDFIYNIFIVPEPNGKFRPIKNLKKKKNKLKNMSNTNILNRNISKLCKIFPTDYFTSVDLADVYFSVHIHSDFQKYLNFHWKRSVWKFVV